jgi:hypothetical protein
MIPRNRAQSNVVLIDAEGIDSSFKSRSLLQKNLYDADLSMGSKLAADINLALAVGFLLIMASTSRAGMKRHFHLICHFSRTFV